MTLEQEILIKENKAREEGREEGIAQGREEGIAQGREEGIAQGRAEIILRMHANGRSIEENARHTG